MTTAGVIVLAIAASFHFISAETNFSNVEALVTPIQDSPRRLNSISEAVADFPGDFHIVGGQEADRSSEPHQVALFINKDGEKKFCGGSLISESWVLTAGHCVKGKNHVGVEVILGAYNISDYEITQELIDVKRIVPHPGYTDRLKDDIALLEMIKSVVLDRITINTIRLPSMSQKEEWFYGQTVTMTGWGKDSDKSRSRTSVLRSVTSNVISNMKCGFMTFTIMPNSQMCVSGYGGKGTCKGDSGGPLYLVENGTKTLIGVTSWGFKWCEWHLPSVFTRVASYLDWIHNVTGIAQRT